MRNKAILTLPTALETPYAQTGHWLFVTAASQFQRVEAASRGKETK